MYLLSLVTEFILDLIEPLIQALDLIRCESALGIVKHLVTLR